ncbi:MAG: lipoprotein LpqH [Propionibacteriales bacterium]|nr:lipoprotein LpqH [Propionibacteriales bacterium]
MKLRLALPLAAAVLALSACAGSGDTTESAPESSAPANAPASSAPASSAPASSAPQGGGGGGNELTVDGKKIELTGEPTCLRGAGKVTLQYPDGSLGLAITEGDPVKVEAVSVVDPDGAVLSYAPGTAGEATATKDGDGWIIEGKATSLSKSGTKDVAFTIKFSC